MDDSIILSDSKTQLAEYLEQIKNFLQQKLHLDLNNKTTIAPCDTGVDFVGYRMWATHRMLKKSTARRMLRHTRNLCELFKQGALEEADLKRYLASINGILSHCDAMGLHAKVYNICIEAGVNVYDF